jgi:hypothetical protein
MSSKRKQAAELRNAIKHVAEMHDATVGFSYTSRGHHRAILFLKEYRRVVTFAASDDWHAFHNVVSQVRRTLRQMGEQT